MNPSAASPLRLRFQPASPWFGGLHALPWVFLLALPWGLAGCGPGTTHYALVEQHLRAGNPAGADKVMQEAEGRYGRREQVLYWMDRGMTLHLAGRYRESNGFLEQADQEIERLYTSRLRTEAKALLVNDTSLPFEGEPFEQVMVNVIKAVNYSAMGDWTEAVVEARRIDHRLNLLSDRVNDQGAYRDDAFARYLSGLLFEVAGERNDAFIAYRKAYEEYRRSSAWIRTPVPPLLQADLLRMTSALHLPDEHAEYQTAFPGVPWQPPSETKDLAQVIVISYNGRAPRKEDRFLDLPISLDALQLVLLTKGVMGPSNQHTRVTESLLYGLSGRVVRVALPALVPQKTQVASLHVQASGPGGSYGATSVLASDLTAIAEKNLKDRYGSLALKAVARAALKFGLAEGASLGAQAAAGEDAGPWVGFLVGLFGKVWAVASEEADKRSWRTLPDEVHVARLWVPPGTYTVGIRPVGRGGNPAAPGSAHTVTLQRGETRLFVERLLQ